MVTPQGIIHFDINDVLDKNKSKPNKPMATAAPPPPPKKNVIILLPNIGLHSYHITKGLKYCDNRFIT